MNTPTHILALATSQPEGVLTADAFLEFVERVESLSSQQANLYRRVVEQTGIQSRRSALIESTDGRSESSILFFETEGEPPSTERRMEVYDAVARKLAHDAATAALHDSQVAPGDITHLVTFSCTGFAAPGWEISLITDLGLPPSTQRLHLGFMGCHAGINALSCAQALWQADPSRTILLVGVELCSLHYQPGLSRDVILPNSLFGDGAAAAVIGNSTSVGASPTLELLATGSHHIPNSEKAMSWQIGDAGFRMTLDASVPDLIKASLRKAMQELVSSAGARLEAIAHWAIHPGGPRILEACLQALELPDDAGAVSRAVMQSCGNMSSVTVLFVLQRLLDEGASGYVGSAAFGPGLCAEMALLRIP